MRRTIFHWNSTISKTVPVHIVVPNSVPNSYSNSANKSPPELDHDLHYWWLTSWRIHHDLRISPADEVLWPNFHSSSATESQPRRRRRQREFNRSSLLVGWAAELSWALEWRSFSDVDHLTVVRSGCRSSTNNAPKSIQAASLIPLLIRTSLPFTRFGAVPFFIETDLER